jgi:hypothetical protein
VERATIFFKSISTRAAVLAKKAVNLPASPKKTKLNLSLKTYLNRINKYTPAVTKVEECTSEDTGVGAAIAAGSQAEKGT